MMTPSDIITRGLPIISLRNFGNFSITADTITSRQTSVNIGTIPSIIGTEESSTGIAAMLDMSIVTTSSDGWSSPNWRFPISLSENVIIMYNMVALISTTAIFYLLSVDVDILPPYPGFIH